MGLHIGPNPHSQPNMSEPNTNTAVTSGSDFNVSPASPIQTRMVKEVLMLTKNRGWRTIIKDVGMLSPHLREDKVALII